MLRRAIRKAPPGAARYSSIWPLTWDNGHMPPVWYPDPVGVPARPLNAVPGASVAHAR
jgi:hypothetical protein